LEFMCLGVPLIVADTRVDRYYFNQDVVTFFEGGNVDSLADSMLELMLDAGARSSQANRALGFVKKYQWQSRKHEYFELVDGLVGKPSTLLFAGSDGRAA